MVIFGVIICMIAASCPTKGTGAQPTTSTNTTKAFVEVIRLDPSIILDIRYATSANFAKTAVYPAARCFLRSEVAHALIRVQKALQRQGLGLKIWDCYRPFSVQKKFWALVPDDRYVAKPVEEKGRMVSGSRHNRGAAVDLTLVDANNGHELAMPSAFDDFSEKAHRNFKGSSTHAVRNSSKLEQVMVAEGFIPEPFEWWHFDYRGGERYELSDFPIDRK